MNMTAHITTQSYGRSYECADVFTFTHIHNVVSFAGKVLNLFFLFLFLFLFLPVCTFYVARISVGMAHKHIAFFSSHNQTKEAQNQIETMTNFRMKSSFCSFDRIYKTPTPNHHEIRRIKMCMIRCLSDLIRPRNKSLFDCVVSFNFMSSLEFWVRYEAGLLLFFVCLCSIFVRSVRCISGCFCSSNENA